MERMMEFYVSRRVRVAAALNNFDVWFASRAAPLKTFNVLIVMLAVGFAAMILQFGVADTRPLLTTSEQHLADLGGILVSGVLLLIALRAFMASLEEGPSLTLYAVAFVANLFLMSDGFGLPTWWAVAACVGVSVVVATAFFVLMTRIPFVSALLRTFAGYAAFATVCLVLVALCFHFRAALP